MRWARLEGRQIGRARLNVDRQQLIRDRRSGMSLTRVAKKHGISRASVCRLVKEASNNPDARVPSVCWERPAGQAMLNDQERLRTAKYSL
jgi:transposase